MTVRYTLVLATKEYSSWSLRPYLALRAIGVPFDEVKIQLRRETTSADVLKHSPSGRVPLLKIEEDGKSFAVWDSLAICETLAERHPEAGLWPEDAQARAHARAISAEMHSGFPDVRDQLGMDFTRRVALPDLREATVKQVARIQAMWGEALAASGGPFLFGRFSIADCMYAPVCSRFRTYGVEMSAPVAAYVERVCALPGMVDWGTDARDEVARGFD